MQKRQPIETAPKNGLAIMVGHEDVGQFIMAWNATAQNPFFAPGQTGMWKTIDGSMTWSDADDCGPDYWMELV